MIDDLDGKSVEKLVSKNDEVLTGRGNGSFQRLKDRGFAIRNVAGQSRVQAGAKVRRLLDELIAQSAGEVRKLLDRPVEHVRGEQSAAGTELNQVDALWRVERTPHLLELAREKAAKDGMHIARGVEVSGLAELLGRTRIVAELGMIKT